MSEILQNGSVQIVDKQLAMLAEECQAEIEQEVSELPIDEQSDDVPLSEPPQKKKKKERDRDLPDWMLDKTTVNELKFCRMFVK